MQEIIYRVVVGEMQRRLRCVCQRLKMAAGE